jgi:hypothetical protein
MPFCLYRPLGRVHISVRPPSHFQTLGAVAPLATAASRLRAVFADWRLGRHYGYPRCCVALYCWDRLWCLPPAMTRYAEQGLALTEHEDVEWVPCGIFHPPELSARRMVQVARLVRFWALLFWCQLHRRGDQPTRFRPPWCAQASPSIGDVVPDGPGPTEAAFAELDSRHRDPDLAWE